MMLYNNPRLPNYNVALAKVEKSIFKIMALELRGNMGNILNDF